MAALTRTMLYAAIRSVQLQSIRCSSKLIPPEELATGLEKREQMAIKLGNEDPFEMKVFERKDGDRNSPNIVKSVNTRRLIGCICEEDQTFVSWMWLEQGEAKRCECGYWFKLSQIEPV